MGMYTANTRSRRKDGFFPVFMAGFSGLGFTITICVAHLIAYQEFPDFRFIIEVILLMGAIGVIAILFQKYFLGGIFLGGAIIGFITDSIIAVTNPGKPSMSSGFSFMLCVSIGFILGIVAEIATVNQRKRHQ